MFPEHLAAQQGFCSFDKLGNELKAFPNRRVFLFPAKNIFSLKPALFLQTKNIFKNILAFACFVCMI